MFLFKHDEMSFLYVKSESSIELLYIRIGRIVFCFVLDYRCLKGLWIIHRQIKSCVKVVLTRLSKEYVCA